MELQVLNMRSFANYFLFLICLLSGGCERDITLEFPVPEPPVIVEGYIENGQNAVVILTRGVPFLGTLSVDDYKKYFIGGAKVIVSNGQQTDTLTEINLDGFILYFSTIKGQAGKTYSLKVEAEGKILSSEARILPVVPLDSIWTVPAKDKEGFVELMCKLSEPAIPGNYYRALTKRNSELFYDTHFQSVYDDKLVNGKTFDFPLLRGKSEFQNNDSADFDQYGFFRTGDTIYVKWAAIERPQFEFWRSFETQGNGFGNPFSSTVIIKSNIKGKGGTGVWASYGAFVDTMIAK